MPGFVKLATLDDLPPGSSRECEHAGQIIALFHIDGGQILAVDGICPHQGGPLANGEVAGTIVTCPWHGWKFDLADGRCLLHPRIKQPTFEVRVDGSDILVLLP
jgi:nitrite reductase/ring-hydroxylating ferredoxin subunit